MKRYDSYKDSGIYFLPKLPFDWKIRKAKFLFKEENRPVRPEDEIVTCFRDGQVTLRKNRRTDGFTNSLKEIGYQGVRKGDLVIHNMDAFAGAIGISDSDGKGTPVYSCCTPKNKDINQYYYCYLLRYLARNGFILSLAKGIRERSTDFRFNDFKELYLPVPSRLEQDLIVSYLDAVTSNIDEAIAQQQKMIDLLNERKQIIINNAVTKGLDPNVKMKSSGIDWIGDIPEHWEVYKIKNLISLLTDYDANGSFSDIAKNCNINTGTPYAWMVRTTDLVNKRYGIVEGNNYCDLKTYNYLSKSSLNSGDLLMTKRGNVGQVYVVPECDNPMTLAPNLYLLRTLKGLVNNKFLMFYLSSFKPQGQLALLNKSTTLGALYKDDVKAMNVILPPIDVQNHIVDWIETRCLDIDEASNSFMKQISLLQERKQIIINDVVTGKIKVYE